MESGISRGVGGLGGGGGQSTTQRRIHDLSPPRRRAPHLLGWLHLTGGEHATPSPASVISNGPGARSQCRAETGQVHKSVQFWIKRLNPHRYHKASRNILLCSRPVSGMALSVASQCRSHITYHQQSRGFTELRIVSGVSIGICCNI